MIEEMVHRENKMPGNDKMPDTSPNRTTFLSGLMAKKINTQQVGAASDATPDAPQVSADVPSPADSKLYVTAVERALKVLMAFDASRRHLSLSQISALTGLDISAIQRFAFTLTSLGYLRRDEGTKKYELSPRLLDFAYHYVASNEMLERALPYVQQLALDTEEATNLSVLDEADVVFVSRIVSRHVLSRNFQVGSRMPAFCTAPGLAMLSTLADGDVADILRKSQLVQYTRLTVTQPEQILARLCAIRERGYAFTQEEYLLGDHSVAAAVVDRSGVAHAAINIAVAKPRWHGADDERRFADLVIAASAAISGQQTPLAALRQER
ncbi:IclR family transcriptional regulator [Cupriavidus pauculus]|uniref:IclR family transcriptional regulator n=1 Tax=Cupriavidus pauculus TaxID=82633 RepID=UPI001D0C7CC8|nr:IclR family transcriptional regulator [Cupriavidus pauculus]